MQTKRIILTISVERTEKSVEEIRAYFLDLCDYYIFQKEEGDGGFVHYQAFLYTKRKKRLSTWGNLLQAFLGVRPHIEPVEGTNRDAKEYCSKEHTRIEGPWSGGNEAVLAVVQGSRSDLAEAAAGILAGDDSVLDNDPSLYLRYSSGVHRLMQLRRRRRFLADQLMPQEVVRIVFTGAAGVGKSRTALSWCRELQETFGWRTYQPLTSPSNSILFDDYDGEEILYVDDFMNGLSYHNYLNVFDEYPRPLPARYAGTYKAWKVVLMTTNLAFPDEFYPSVQDQHARAREAIERRFHPVVFGNDQFHNGVPTWGSVATAACRHFRYRVENFVQFDEEVIEPRLSLSEDD